MFTFTISGAVLEAETRRPLAGLFVKAVDEDLVFDDVLGSAVTGDDGTFEIVSELRDFREILERRPDIYFRLSRHPGGKVIHSTGRGVAFDAGELSYHEILVPAGSAPGKPHVSLMGDDGETRDDFGPGENVIMVAGGLRPGTAYDARVEENGDELFTARFMTNRSGELPPTILWPQAFLDDPRREGVLTLNEARERWVDSTLRVVLSGARKPVLESGLTFAGGSPRPVAFAADAQGRPRNGLEPNGGPLFLTVAGMTSGGPGRVSLTPRRHDWCVGDAFESAVLADGEPAVFDVELPEEGTATIELVDSARLRSGIYDFVIRPIRYGWEEDQEPRFGARDVATRLVTGLVVREDFWTAKPVLGGCINKIPVSGHPVSGTPYYRYTDTFEVGEDVWGALDPGIVDPNNLSKMCAFYVIPSKDAAQWTDTSLNHLAVLGGNPAVPRIKVQSGCINCNTVLLWSNASDVGEYDIVADFGVPTPDAASFAPDNSYDTPLDIIDGYLVAGFRVVRDPGTMSDFAHAGYFNYTEATSIPGFGTAGSVTVQDENQQYHAPGNFSAVNVNVPRRAHVYFPADAAGVTNPAQISAVAANYPVIVIVHGNGHSYTSYDTLLAHLARNGFIACSIHLNGNMAALGRANVMFQHLPLLQAMFGPKMQDNIGLMGHSRGGEAVVKAARLNQTGGFGHAINAVLALAPTDQYGSEVLGGAWATPYFVLYGSRDGDIDGSIWVSGYMVPMTGFASWDRSHGARKTMAFVHRATHNGFITNNGDAEAADIPELLSPADQQTVTMSYVNAFFRQYLKNEEIWNGMFTGEWKPASLAPAVDVYVQYQDTTFTAVDDFQSGAGWQASSIGGTLTQTGLPANPNEGKMHHHPSAPGIDPRSPHDTNGLTLRWDGLGDELVFTVPAAHKNVSGFEALSVRISQKDGSPHNPANQLQNLRVALRDTAGHERGVRVGSFGVVPFPDQRATAFLRKSALTTIRIPLSSYTIVAAGADQIDLTEIAQVKLRFTETPAGEIDIDDVEFTD